MTAFLTPGIESLNLRINAPLEADGVTVRDDLSNVKVWYSTVGSTFDVTTEGTLAYNGLGLSITITGLTPGTTYYVKYALISEIDPANYIVSSALSAVPDSTAGSLDATPAPTPTGVSFNSGFSHILITQDNPTYSQGSGHGKAYLYGILYTTGVAPTFNTPGVTNILQFTGNIAKVPANLGETWYLWLKWETKDGVQSVSPFGPSVVTLGKIGNVDLGPLIIEAGNLAQGAVSSSKFASDIEPVTTVAAVPTTKSTNTVFNTTDGKLYRWNGTTYVSTVSSADLSGTLTNAQLDDIAATKITGQLASTQIANNAITAAKLATDIELITNVTSVPTTKSTNVIFNTTDGKLYRWNGTSYSASIPSADISGTITATQISTLAASQITGTLANNQLDDIATAKLSGQITETQITDSAISSGKIAAGAITTAKLDAAAITAEKIATNAVTAAKIEAGAVTAAKIEAGAVTTAKLDALAVTTAKLDALAVTADKIAVNAITADKIDANAITAGKIAAGAVSADKIAAGAITVQKLLVTPVSLCPDPFFADQAWWGGTQNDANGWFFEDGTFLSAKTRATLWSGHPTNVPGTARKHLWSSPLVPPAAGITIRMRCRAVNTSNQVLHLVLRFSSAAGASLGDAVIDFPVSVSVATDYNVQYVVPANAAEMRFIIYNDGVSVYSGAASVTGVMVDVAASADLIVDGAITTNKMIANSIDGNRITANTLSAEKIIAGSITSDKIAANSITTSKLLVTGQGTALNDDPSTVDLSAWETTNTTVVTDTTCPAGLSVFESSSLTWIASRRMSIDINRNYQYRFWIKKTAGTAITYGMVQFFDAAGGVVCNAGGTWAAEGTYNYFGLVGNNAPSDWTEYVISFGPNETSKIPAGAKKFAVGAILNYNNSVTPTTRIAGMRVFEKTQGDMVVDGTINASKLVANSITAGQIAAGAITTNKLLVTGKGKAINDDPFLTDASAWITDSGSTTISNDSTVPSGSNFLRATNGTQFTARSTPITQGTKYKISLWARKVSGSGTLYIRLYCFNSANTLLNYAITSITPATPSNFENLTVPSGWTKYTGYITPDNTSVTALIYIHANWNTTGITDFADIRLEEYIGADLIVDGAITAGKLAANSIAVGSAAIENGAITNAMIENLNADKINAGTLSADRIAGESITAVKIDSRGLSIKDASGNIILAAGSALDFSNVGGATKPANNANNTYLDSSGNIQGVSSGAGNSVANNTDSVITRPGGGVYTTQTPTINGAIKIKTPGVLNSSYPMLKFDVEIYEYIAGYSCTISIAGHTSDVNWYNVTARVTGGNVEYPVYFGHDGSNFCVWIGTPSESWSYPQVFVRNVLVGYTSMSASLWSSGWVISFDTASRYYTTTSVVDTYPGADWSKTARRPANIAALTGSEGINNANITIGATGVLSGAGGGQVTTMPTVDNDREGNPAPNAFNIGTIKQFKHAAAIGLSDYDGYWVTLETIIQYPSSGGGYPGYQYCYQHDKTWRRRAGNDAGTYWTSWVQDLDRNAYTGELDATKGANADNFTGKVGGGNLLAVGSLAHASTDNYPAGWKVAYSSITPTITRYTTGGAVGDGAYLKINAFYPSGGLIALQCGGGTNGLAGGVRGGFIAGRTYTISFYMRYAGPIGLSVDVTASGAGMGSLTPVSGALDTSGDWYRLVYRGTCTTTFATGIFYMNFNHTGYTGSIQMSNVQVEEGDVVTAYSETTYGPITAATASTFIANAAIGTAQVGTLTANNLTVSAVSNTVNGGATSGGRIVIDSNKILVYDTSNVVRVKIGYLL